MAHEYYDNSYENVNNEHYGDRSSYDRAAERKRIYRRRRIIRRRIVASLIMLFIIALIFFVVSLFIRVKDITITGTFGRYCYEDVLAASGIEKGDRLLYISPEGVENRIEKELPYMVNIKVKKRLFSKVYIEVDSCSEAYCLYTDGKYAVVSSDFKVLRFEDTYEQSGVLVVKGIEGGKASLSDTLSFADDVKFECMKKLCEGFDVEKFGKLSLVDVTDTLNLRVVFKSGLEIKLGNYINLDYNLKWAETVMSELEQRHGYVDGTLDLSIFKKAYYTPRSGEEETIEKN